MIEEDQVGGQHRGHGTTGPGPDQTGGQTYQPHPSAWTQPPAAPGPSGWTQPGWPTAGPAEQPSGRGASAWTHFKRAIDWDVATVVVSPREAGRLSQAGVEPRLHALFAWRRSCMLVALPFLLVGVVLSFIEAKDRPSPTSFATGDGRSGFTDFGKLWSYLPSIGLVRPDRRARRPRDLDRDAPNVQAAHRLLDAVHRDPAHRGAGAAALRRGPRGAQLVRAGRGPATSAGWAISAVSTPERAPTP
ncbi:MAG TPA: hypothetical protein VGL39_22825 [Jatrophihabitantaceae bacterium]|jgi:hypothetical protein